jgi:methionyl-tRNA formyltransferase
MAPLPEYRGCNQFSFAIIDDVKEFGTTLHVMTSGIDSGDLLFENRFPIQPDETAQSLHQKTTEASIQLFNNSIANIFKGHYFSIEQSSLYQMRSHSFHLRSEVNDIKQIDCHWPDEKIDRYVRATYFPPFPPPFTVVKGQKIDLSLNWRKEIPR